MYTILTRYEPWLDMRAGIMYATISKHSPHFEYVTEIQPISEGMAVFMICDNNAKRLPHVIIYHRISAIAIQ